MSPEVLVILWYYWNTGESLGPATDGYAYVGSLDWHVRIPRRTS